MQKRAVFCVLLLSVVAFSNGAIAENKWKEEKVSGCARAFRQPGCTVCVFEKNSGIGVSMHADSDEYREITQHLAVTDGGRRQEIWWTVEDIRREGGGMMKEGPDVLPDYRPALNELPPEIRKLFSGNFGIR